MRAARFTTTLAHWPLCSPSIEQTKHTKQMAGRTSIDFWRSRSRGFWHAIVPYGDIDLEKGYPSSVPEGKGWKAALTAFTGDESVGEFYAAFEAFVSPNGKVASEAALLALLEDDDSIHTMSLDKVDTTSADFMNGPQVRVTTQPENSFPQAKTVRAVGFIVGGPWSATTNSFELKDVTSSFYAGDTATWLTNPWLIVL